MVYGIYTAAVSIFIILLLSQTHLYQQSGSSNNDSLRVSGRYLKKLKTALSHRSAILNDSLREVRESVKENLYGNDVKIVRKNTRKLRFLTDAEKDGVAEKYQSGMTMMAIADLYGCHYTTVGCVLRVKGVEIRSRKKDENLDKSIFFDKI
ncbi:MAG: hypothetical protein FWC09_10865 [Lachnospiraceae bacterium]|nr:hypothetical protein [Lachnospiraceae bacterium]